MVKDHVVLNFSTYSDEEVYEQFKFHSALKYFNFTGDTFADVKISYWETIYNVLKHAPWYLVVGFNILRDFQSSHTYQLLDMLLQTPMLEKETAVILIKEDPAEIIYKQLLLNPDINVESDLNHLIACEKFLDNTLYKKSMEVFNIGDKINDERLDNIVNMYNELSSS